MPTDVEEEIEVIDEEDKALWMQQYQEWQEPLVGLWTAIGKEVDPAALKHYTRQFGSVPQGLLQQMADRAIKDNGIYKSVPTIGACWQALYKVLGNPQDIDRAIEHWVEQRWQQAVYKFQ